MGVVVFSTIADAVIDKRRFPTNQEGQLRNEATIIQDFQLWCVLRAFEQRMGSIEDGHLTHEGHEERWRGYAQERALVFPQQLCCDAGNSYSD